MNLPRRLLLLLGLVGCLSAVGTGCGGGSASRSGSESGVQRASEAGRDGGRDSVRGGGTVRTETAGLLGRDIGLELQVWSTEASEGLLAEALSEYLGEPQPFAPHTVSLWRANGLRCVSVPMSELANVQRRLEGSAAVRGSDRQWLGQLGGWTAVYRGPASADARVLAMDSGRVSLPSGRFRLLVRAWVNPAWPESNGTGSWAGGSAGPRAALRVELVPQYQETVRRGSEAGLDLRGPTMDDLEEGQVFERLALAGVMNGGRAVLIVPDRPESDWMTMAAAEPEVRDVGPRAGGDAPGGGVGRVTRGGERANGGARGGEPERAPLSPIGPRPAGPLSGVPAYPTLGSAMLTPAWGAAGGPIAAPVLGERGASVQPTAGSRRRTVLVLIPRVPERYTLLGE
ncbi:MAG: hypothetical protein KF768_01920 [Phycisphaeraceae bacterium]|nr:hypothetical protein [Phycisphaeraceae bacterium]